MRAPDACRVVSVANMKGGVGKTTTVVALAETFAARSRDARVLVVDMDPQASASFCLVGNDYLGKLITANRTLQAFLEARLGPNPPPIGDYICEQFSYTVDAGRQLPIDILVTGTGLRTFEREVIVKLTKKKVSYEAIRTLLSGIIHGHLHGLRQSYSHVLFDCPPGLSIVAEAAIALSDAVIVPTIPDEVSNFGLSAFCQALWADARDTVERPALPLVLLNRVQATGQHKATIKGIEVEATSSDRAYDLLDTRLKQSTELSKAIAHSGHGYYQVKYPGLVGKAVDDLASEIETACDRNRRIER